MAWINLIAWDNGRGLGHDVRLLQQALVSLGHRVHITTAGPHRNDGRWQALAQRAGLWFGWMRSFGRQPRRFDVNIALEHVRPHHLRSARINLLVPNPEWCSPRSQRYLGRYDAVLCKTAHAMALFAPLARRVLHIGFSSADCLDDAVPREAGFLHIAGVSPLKGTERLLEVWRRHPQWPTLTVLQSPDVCAGPAPDNPPNLRHLVQRLPPAELRQLQNSHRFHVCLSETEGWGHYIVEAMSCKAVVLTCDAVPMNELVGTDRGVLVQATPAGMNHLATRFHFDQADFEAQMQRLLAMPAAAQEQLGLHARAWFDATAAGFPGRVRAALEQVL